MSRAMLLLAVGLISIGLLVAGVAQEELSVNAKSLLMTLSLAGLFAAIAGWLTTFDRGRTPAFLRIDWFVPMLRRTKDGQAHAPTLVGRLLRSIVPAGFQSNHGTKKRGFVRKTLRRLGISWLASPVRRIVQAICLSTFLILFFYVCWPYNARPAEPGRVSLGWSFKEIDQDSGEFLFSQIDTSLPWLQEQATVFLVEQQRPRARSRASICNSVHQGFST